MDWGRMLKYSIDTNALIDCWRRHYPKKIFPKLWTNLDEIVRNGRLVATDYVYIELGRVEDELLEWAKLNRHMFLPMDKPVQDAGKNILAVHRNLINLKRNSSMGDPWVIAVAQVHQCAVVTTEVATGDPNRPKIPDVCKLMGIDCFNLLQFFEKEGWSF